MRRVANANATLPAIWVTVFVELSHACFMQVLHDRVVEELDELGDEEVQRRLWWSAGDGDALVSSFTECVCGLFDDSGLGVALDHGASVFGAEIDEHLRDLRRRLRSIDDRRSPGEITDDERLEPLRPIARELAQAIRQLAS